MSESTAHDRSFRILEWTVLVASNELIRGDDMVRIEPVPMRVLTYLAERAGQPVTRHELLESIWVDSIVTENALTRSISHLRRAFDDDPGNPKVIETLPKVGYRLTAAVTLLSADEVAAFRQKRPDNAQGEAVSDVSPSRPVRGRGKRWRLAAEVALAVAVILTIAFLIQRQTPSRASVTAVVLETPPDEVRHTAWSRDGRSVAVTYVDGTKQGIAVKRVGEANYRTVTAGPADAFPAWSDDGTRIAFLRCDVHPCSIYKVPSQGGVARPLTNAHVEGRGLDWSPDGRHLVAVARGSDDDAFGIAILTLSTGARRFLTGPTRAAADHNPTFSPDGRWITFERHTANGADLWRVPVEGGTADRLTTDDHPIAGHTWSEDGRELIFASNRSGAFMLWRIDVDGGSPVVHLESQVNPAWPDIEGDRLAVADRRFDTGIWRRAPGGEVHRIVAPSFAPRQPALSPDGARIAFVSSQSDGHTLWLADADGSNTKQLTDFGGAEIAHPHFSPDGRRVVFQASPEGNADLWIMAVDGGTPRRLTDSRWDEVAPRFSRDGRDVYYGSNSTGSWHVWKVSADGGDAILVADQEAITAEEVPDGAVILAPRHNNGLRRLEAGKMRLLTPGPLLGDWMNWTVTDRGIMGLNRPAGSLALVDAWSGLGRNLDLPLGPLLQGERSFAASADGQTIVWSRLEGTTSRLVIVKPGQFVTAPLHE